MINWTAYLDTEPPLCVRLTDDDKANVIGQMNRRLDGGRRHLVQLANGGIIDPGRVVAVLRGGPPQ